MRVLNTPFPTHPYRKLIRELDISGSAADDLYMGDLDAALNHCTEMGMDLFLFLSCFPFFPYNFYSFILYEKRSFDYDIASTYQIYSFKVSPFNVLCYVQ